ncbi:MAG: hypothetical protein HYT80_07735 [Euryarchaeota archaeon]|nr:hypothetical protein [Euryarchaeota archaeon]
MAVHGKVGSVGLKAWLRSQRTPDPKRPWVRPEFLGLFALLMASGAGVAWFASAGSDGGAAPPVAATQRDYVGLTPAESLACAPDCNVEGLYFLWGLDHPDARILEKNEVRYQGILIGYELVYVVE